LILLTIEVVISGIYHLSGDQAIVPHYTPVRFIKLYMFTHVLEVIFLTPSEQHPLNERLNPLDNRWLEWQFDVRRSGEFAISRSPQIIA